MKFYCKKDELYETFGNVSHAAATKLSVDNLEGVKLFLGGGKLEMTGYDLSMGIKKTIEVDSEDRGEAVVNAHLFLEILRRMPDEEISVEIDDNFKVTISSGVVTYNINAGSANEYPDIPPIDESNHFSIQQNILKNMINQTIYAVKSNSTMPVLSGELFDVKDGLFNLVAVDGYRIAFRSEKVSNEHSMNFVVPARSLTEVSRIISDSEEECSIIIGPKHAIFNINGYMIFTRLLEGNFHNYKGSIPPTFKTEAIVKVREMLEMLDRCSLLISDTQKAPVCLTFSEGRLDVKCSTSLGKVSDTMNIEISGAYFEIGFNYKYLSDALRASEVDKVKIEMNAPLSPVKISPVQGDSFTYLVLPMMINN